MNKLFALLFSVLSLSLCAQEEDVDLLDLIEEEETIDYAIASFKANRVINLHSLETTSKRVLDIKISHRLGVVTGGFQEWYGLDQATVRIGGDYGITDRLMVGLGRSSFEKTYDSYALYKFLRQSKGARNMPVTALLMTSAAINTMEFPVPQRDNLFSSRMFYTHQLIVGRKFSEAFSLEVVPTLVHRNLVATDEEAHDVFAMGFGSRLKLTKRLSLNTEYIYVLPDQLAEQYRNSASVGIDIETGGHVFQLHFTNSTAMNDKGVVTETLDNWETGDFRFGFNVSRVFTIKKKNRPFTQ